MNGSATVSVKDTGIGIPEDELPRIFDRFYRVDKARTRQAGGAGIGISLGRSIAEAHGGSILVESPSGGGAKFQGVLPVASKKKPHSKPGPTTQNPMF